ncbi:MFS transporter [Kribbella turkmenica]|uniref:MFS transporter n=1 Tax=Kribbella turkmenica TaxID=2530375 RepID=A0A4R4XEU8_9ACTN|nr:MFS transporter [Kribbella turkmenica]TDD29210.1 MFS transporter [Kribbella turkmenica]
MKYKARVADVADSLPLRRNRPFAFFWTAQLLSNAGTQISELAIPLVAVLLLSASPAEMGVLTALESLPSLLLSVVLGVLVDRVRRRRMLFWCNIGQALLIGSVPLAAAFDVLTMTHLCVVAFAVGGLALGYSLAHVAYVPALVTDRRQLTAANSSIAPDRLRHSSRRSGPWRPAGTGSDGSCRGGCRQSVLLGGCPAASVRARA